MVQCLLKVFVLIVPLWNWNVRWCFNSYTSWRCSNRTFMELKFHLCVKTPQRGNCSNRTFMELKFYKAYYDRFGLVVLIVPLWNWNDWKEFREPIISGVLIVPLWNWNIYSGVLWICSTLCSNRTFMELKYQILKIMHYSTAVLIVPLWNWNLCLCWR